MKFLPTLCLSSALAASALANTVTLKPAIADLNDLDHHTPVSWGFALSGLDLSEGMFISKAVIKIHSIRNWNDLQNKLFIDLIDNPTNGLKFYNDEKAPDSDKKISDYFTDGTYKPKTGQEITRLTCYSDRVKGNKTEEFSYLFTKSQLGKLTDYLESAPGFDVSYKTETYWETETYKKWVPAHWEGTGINKKWIPGAYVNAFRSVKKSRQVPVYTPQATVGLGFDADCHYYNTGVEFEVTTRKVPDATATLGLFGAALAGLALMRRRK